MMFSFIKNNYKLLGAFFFSLLTILLLVVIILLIVDGVNVSYFYDLQYNLNFPENSFGSVHANPLVVPALISAGASFLSSIFGGSSQANANATNLKIARETNAMNAYQAALNRNWQSQMNAENNAFNARMADLAWNRETAWNSAEAQMQRLQAAGINPFVAAADVAQVTGNSSAPQAQAGSSPAGATATAMPVQVQPENYLGGFASSALQFAQAFASLAQAKKTGVETGMLEKNLNTWLAQNESQLEELNLKNYNQAITNDIFAEYGRSEKAYMLAEVAGRVQLNLAKEEESIANKALIMQTIDKVVEEMHLTKAQAEQCKALTPLLLKTEEQRAETLRKQGIAAEASASASYASAQKSIAEAHQVNELTGVIKDLTKNKAEMTKAEANSLYVGMVDKLLDLGVKYQTLPYQIQNAYNQAKHGNMQNIVDQYNYINGFMEHNSQSLPLIGSMVKFGGF